MNRKGFLFSIFLLLFFVSFFFLLLAYKHWYSGALDATQGFTQAQSVAYMYDDISQDFAALNDFQDIAIVRKGSNVTVSFLGGFNSSNNYTSLFSSYETILENSYADQVNRNISLSSVAYGFSIPEYRTSTKVTGMGTGVSSTYSVFIDNYQNLTGLNVTLMVRNNTRPTTTKNPSSSSGALTHVQVTILDSSATNQLLQETVILNGNDSNDDFEARFTGGNQVRITFGTISSRDGVLFF